MTLNLYKTVNGWMLYYFVVKVQMNILMMKMSAGKLGELLPSA